jgi:2',3'-cyclic-nucleotide 2'-phosphodiesterase (5'-nucleotidase family)
LTGSITYGDLLAVAPFSNTVDIIKISGETLKNIFEFTVHDYDPKALDPFGGFLQVAGEFVAIPFPCCVV